MLKHVIVGLACLQSEDNSFELCTPYADSDFRTD